MKWNGPYRALSLALHHWPALRAAIVNVPATRKWAFLGAFSEPGRNGLIDGILLALHESRRRQAEREIQLYDHLIQYARMYPLIFDGQDKPIGPAAE